jgi:predicted DNA-binding transcriptional regulator AlpA
MGTKPANHQPPAPLLSVEQVAEWLQIPKNTLYRQNSQGTPPGNLGVRIGRYLRYDGTRIQHWLNQGGRR